MGVTNIQVENIIPNQARILSKALSNIEGVQGNYIELQKGIEYKSIIADIKITLEITAAVLTIAKVFYDFLKEEKGHANKNIKIITVFAEKNTHIIINQRDSKQEIDQKVSKIVELSNDQKN